MKIQQELDQTKIVLYVILRGNGRTLADMKYRHKTIESVLERGMLIILVVLDIS
jgi:hypothetical protein